MKNYIYKQIELDLIPVSERSKYYFDDYLVAAIKGFSQDSEEMVEVKPDKLPFLVEPFWEDKEIKVNDLDLQTMLNKEGLFFRKYIDKHPNFSFFLREKVVQKLIKVQNQLPKHLKLVLKAGYRPLEVQRELFTDNLIYFKNKFPEKTEQELYKMNLEFVADPDNFIPPHSTGAAIDLYLLDNRSNQPLDMGSPINYPDDLSWTWNIENLTKAQAENRKFLTETMLKYSFANLASEWWHYSYGDQYWALFYNQNECLYNSVKIV